MFSNYIPQPKEIVNDLDDFKMPYRLYGRTDLEIMIDKYQKLSNQSYGLTKRFNYGASTNFNA